MSAAAASTLTATTFPPGPTLPARSRVHARLPQSINDAAACARSPPANTPSALAYHPSQPSDDAVRLIPLIEVYRSCVSFVYIYLHRLPPPRAPVMRQQAHRLQRLLGAISSPTPCPHAPHAPKTLENVRSQDAVPLTTLLCLGLPCPPTTAYALRPQITPLQNLLRVLQDDCTAFFDQSAELRRSRAAKEARSARGGRVNIVRRSTLRAPGKRDSRSVYGSLQHAGGTRR
ncbi:hypothetical protein C8J57DRAFT_1500830 [Mycena rebaudengoi]|nr:hypothetical protein C8J57DRAFT_1500830 [Mycena rebaudengoi]